MKKWKPAPEGVDERHIGWAATCSSSRSLLYGGFFGAGMGILMIAALAIQGLQDVHRDQRAEELALGGDHSVAVATFVIADAVSLPHTLVMLVTATIGGYWGAAVARKLLALWLRRFIIAVGGVLTVYYFDQDALSAPMLAGLSAALGAGLLWGLVFLTPLLLADYPPFMLAIGRYLAFGVLALGLAWFDRAALAPPHARRLDRGGQARADRQPALLLHAGGAIQLAGGPVPTLIIGTLPVVIAITANLLDPPPRRRRGQRAMDASLPPWRSSSAACSQVYSASAHALPAEASADHLLGIGFGLFALGCWTWYPICNSRWLRPRRWAVARVGDRARGWRRCRWRSSPASATGCGTPARTGGPGFAWPSAPAPKPSSACASCSGWPHPGSAPCCGTAPATCCRPRWWAS